MPCDPVNPDPCEPVNPITSLAEPVKPATPCDPVNPDPPEPVKPDRPGVPIGETVTEVVV